MGKASTVWKQSKVVNRISNITEESAENEMRRLVSYLIQNDQPDAAKIVSGWVLRIGKVVSATVRANLPLMLILTEPSVTSKPPMPSPVRELVELCERPMRIEDEYDSLEVFGKYIAAVRAHYGEKP